MRVVMYIVILAALFLAPLQRMEIANLEPIQAVWLYAENGTVFLETDTEDQGGGSTVADALADMKRKSPGIIYLDTAQYLFVSPSATQNIAALQPLLKESVRLCIWDGQGEIHSAVKYADSHKIGIKMKQWKETGDLPELSSVKLENSDKITS